MQDRIPTYPGRVKMTLPDGSVQYVTLERADEPVQEGTPLNKETLLTDETAQILGIKSDDPTVDDAFRTVQDALKVGDIKATVNPAPGEHWYLCNGDRVHGHDTELIDLMGGIQITGQWGKNILEFPKSSYDAGMTVFLPSNGHWCKVHYADGKIWIAKRVYEGISLIDTGITVEWKSGSSLDNRLSCAYSNGKLYILTSAGQRSTYTSATIHLYCAEFDGENVLTEWTEVKGFKAAAIAFVRSTSDSGAVSSVSLYSCKGTVYCYVVQYKDGETDIRFACLTDTFPTTIEFTEPDVYGGLDALQNANVVNDEFVVVKTQYAGYTRYYYSFLIQGSRTPYNPLIRGSNYTSSWGAAYFNSYIHFWCGNYNSDDVNLVIRINADGTYTTFRPSEYDPPNAVELNGDYYRIVSASSPDAAKLYKLLPNSSSPYYSVGELVGEVFCVPWNSRPVNPGHVSDYGTFLSDKEGNARYVYLPNIPSPANGVNYYIKGGTEMTKNTSGGGGNL